MNDLIIEPDFAKEENWIVSYSKGDYDSKQIDEIKKINTNLKEEEKKICKNSLLISKYYGLITETEVKYLMKHFSPRFAKCSNIVMLISKNKYDYFLKFQFNPAAIELIPENKTIEKINENVFISTQKLTMKQLMFLIINREIEIIRDGYEIQLKDVYCKNPANNSSYLKINSIQQYKKNINIMTNSYIKYKTTNLKNKLRELVRTHPVNKVNSDTYLTEWVKRLYVECSEDKLKELQEAHK